MVCLRVCVCVCACVCVSFLLGISSFLFCSLLFFFPFSFSDSSRGDGPIVNNWHMAVLGNAVPQNKKVGRVKEVALPVIRLPPPLPRLQIIFVLFFVFAPPPWTRSFFDSAVCARRVGRGYYEKKPVKLGNSIWRGSRVHDSRLVSVCQCPGWLRWR